MRYNFLTLHDHPPPRGSRVILRADLNVPITVEAVRDHFRIDRLFATLTFLKDASARTLILSHLDEDGAGTLKPVAAALATQLPVSFAPTIAEAKEKFSTLAPGSFLLLENIRCFNGEKENDPGFAKTLASLAEWYVNDAFSVSHRRHASVVGVPRYLPSFAGPLLVDEVTHLSRAFDPPRPFLFIVGGEKFETKLPLIKKFLSRADCVFVGGALANEVFKAKGYDVGRSLVSSGRPTVDGVIGDPRLLLPHDVVVERRGEEVVVVPTEVGKDDVIVDTGPHTLADVRRLIDTAAFILWNGPLGVYERGFTTATEELASAISASHAESVVGGGDTITAIAKLELMHQFSFVSTGGGAMLEFLATGSLPGIEALGHSVGA